MLRIHTHVNPNKICLNSTYAALRLLKGQICVQYIMIHLCTFSKSGEVVEGEMIGVDVEPDGEEAPGQVQHIIIQVCSLAQSFDHFLNLIFFEE